MALMDSMKILFAFVLYFICELVLSYACMYYTKAWIYDVTFMTCGLFLILHHVASRR